MDPADLHDLIAAMPVVSSHTHHLIPEASMDLDGLLSRSYVGWMAPPPGPHPEARAAFVRDMSSNTYFIWLSRALERLYEQGPVDAGNWDAISRAVAEANAAPEHHFATLVQRCRWRFAVLDCYWNRGDDLGRPDLFRPTYRIDSWVSCFSPEVRDHDGNSLWADTAMDPPTLDDYLDGLDQAITEARRRGAVALKSASAYERPVAYDNPDLGAARRAFRADPATVSRADALAFGDVAFHHCCRAAEREGIPFQVHLGLGQISGSRPLLFEPIIRQYPRVTFDLFHGGYPWTSEVAGLLHNYPNVIADLCWLPLISTTAAVRALHEYLDVAGATSRILWGDDTWTSEEAYGAVLAWEHVVSRVLAERLEWGLLREGQAKDLAERLMWRNGDRVFTH